MNRRHALGPALVAAMLLLGQPAAAPADVAADQAAEMLLNSGRKAFNEQNYSFAAGRFQEFLQRFGGHPQAGSVRYALAMCFIEGPEPNFEKAIENLHHPADNAGVPEHAYAAYYMGIAQRGLALNEFALAATKHGDEQKLIRTRAEGRCQDAARRFAAASAAFAAKAPKTNGTETPPELDWAARARCDQAEMEIRSHHYKEAQALAEKFLADPAFAKSRYRNLGFYYHGYASFLLQDYLVAGRSLNQLTPFDDPVYGLHSRYLMGRIYQVTEEQDKALAMYEGVLADFEKQKREAIEALKNRDQFKNNPAERARLEALAKNPPPDYVSGSLFFSACQLYETGKFGEALGKFQSFAKDHPGTPFEQDAALRVGYCQVQLKMFPEAIATLKPIAEKNPKLNDQALLWLGKAEAGAALSAEAKDSKARENGLKSAQATLRTAADRAQQKASTDPDARRRRGEASFELADVQQQAGQYKEAAGLLEQLRNERALPGREEELAERLITAQHLAHDLNRSEQLVGEFQRDFPRSTLMPHVVFRSAENAYFRALDCENQKDFPRAELPKLFEEAGKRYQTVLERYPEFERANLARYGLAMCFLKRNEFEEAQRVLETIPAADRNGELGNVPYLLAECLIRFAPAKAEDALQVGMLQEKLQQAAQNLEAYLAAQPKSSHAPDALLKLGVCQTRLATLNAQPQERGNMLAAARKTFETLMQQFPAEPEGVQAVLERAKCMTLQGDKNGAVNELRRFTADPLQHNPVAAVAVVQLATLLREQNKAEEAANILNGMRQRHEGNWLKDNKDRAALIRFHQGVCLQEAGKFAEAKAQLESIPAMAENRPIAVEAFLRGGQCRVAEIRTAITKLQQQLGAGKPEQRADLERRIQDSFIALNDAGIWMRDRGEETAAAHPGLEARIRLYYEAAWAWRSVAQREIAAAASRLQQERQRKLQQAADKQAAPGTKAAAVPLPEIRRGEVPLQPAEERMRKAYQQLIGYGLDMMLAIEARFELAELLAEREEHDEAIKLLREALDKEPSDNKAPGPEFLDKVRLRLGACLAAKNDYAAALEKFLAVADNPKSPFVAEAQYRTGDCLLAMNDTDRAIPRLALFRDKPEFHQVYLVSDRAMLRLGQAYAAGKQWELSRQAFELFTHRYGGSPWIQEGRFGLGWALQNLGQFDQAVKSYEIVINNSANELTARAHLNVGLCRLEQKRYAEAATSLLIVPYTFQFPELSAAALAEAARALVADKKPDEAEKLLNRVIKDYPDSGWAKVAQKRLDEFKK